jgi:hypothetical protein
MAVDNNTPLSGTPLSLSTSPQMPGLRTAANGEVLNSNERVVTPAELAAQKAAAAGDPKAVAQDGKQKAAGDALAAEQESENPIRNMFKRVQQTVQNLQEKSAANAEREKRDQANAQYFAQNAENRGMFDPVESGSTTHTLGTTNGDGNDSHTTTGFHPIQSAQEALHHAHDAMLDTVRDNLPHQAPAPIREANVEYVEHARPETAVASTAPASGDSHNATGFHPAQAAHDMASDAAQKLAGFVSNHTEHQAPAPIREASVEQVDHTRPESALASAAPVSRESGAPAESSGFHPLDAIANAVGHARDQIADHLPHTQQAEQVAQPLGQPDIKVSELPAGAPSHEAAVAEVAHTGGAEQVAQPTPQADIKVSALEHEHAAPIRDAVVAEVTHPGAPEQVAQPMPLADIKVSALESAAPIRDASISTVNHAEQIAQPIAQPDIKVSALETPAPSASHSPESLIHGPQAATQAMASGMGGESLAAFEHGTAQQPQASQPSAALHGIQSVDPAAVGSAAQAALEASRAAAVHVGEPVPNPAIQVAALNPEHHTAAHAAAHAPAHAVHHTTVAAHHPATNAHDTAVAQVKDSAHAPAPAQMAQSQQHHDSTHLAGMDNAAAAFMGNAARNAAKEQESSGRNMFANTERPHLTGVGDIDKDMTGLAGLGLASAMGEKTPAGKSGQKEYAGNAPTFAADHLARSDVHKALEEHWAKAGVPAQEAKTSVAAIAPKLNEHLEKSVHPDAKLAYYSKGDVAVAIEHPHHQAHAKPTTSVAMATLQDVHKHGMPHEAIKTIQANLGKDVEGMSKLDVMGKFSPQVVRAIGDEGFPHAEVAETKFHLEAGMRNAGAQQPEVSRADALQALGVVATDSSTHVQAMDKATGQSYQFTTEQLQQSMGFSNDRSASAPTAPAQEMAMEQGRTYSHR